METKEEIARELETVDRRSRELLDDLSDEQLRVPYSGESIRRSGNWDMWPFSTSIFF